MLEAYLENKEKHVSVLQTIVNALMLVLMLMLMLVLMTCGC